MIKLKKKTEQDSIKRKKNWKMIFKKEKKRGSTQQVTLKIFRPDSLPNLTLKLNYVRVVPI